MDGMSGIGYLNFMADMKNIRDKKPDERTDGLF